MRQGIKRQRPHLGNAGRDIMKRMGTADGSAHTAAVQAWFLALQDRLARVRVCCGDWTRIMGEAPTVHQPGLTGIVLDPPYAHAERDSAIYAVDQDISAAVRTWALAHGGHPRLRIVLCGYSGEHAMPANWQAVPWKANGGYGSMGTKRARASAHREMLWCSPHCQPVTRQQLGLFASTQGDAL